MRITDILSRKRAGLELSSAEIESIILGYARGDVPDYQMSAWLMAVCLRGLSSQETVDLTQALVRSGTVLDWAGHPPFVVDKHSSGGVGDKTTLVVVPMVAATGLPVAKMSGRGLGFTGGTLDKLESIPGFRVGLSLAEMRQQVESIGLAIVAQTSELAPADGKLYALRDATATVDYLPLIASSIISKKIAAGAHGIVLDVKAGRGAFMAGEAEARQLAVEMLALARTAGRRASAVISSMAAPLGLAVGNALEVREAIATMQGNGPADLRELALTLGARMLLLAERAPSLSKARLVLEDVLRSGAALESFRRLVVAQGGDPAVLDDPESLPQAPVRRRVITLRGGLLRGVDPRRVAEVVVALGGGRARKEDTIDPGVGVVLFAKPGAGLAHGDILFEIHARSESDAESAELVLNTAYELGDSVPPPSPLVLDVLE
ncbi:MAG: thymidine phosphorylase [Chloroflexota bacterium]